MEGKGALRITKGSNPYIAMGLEPLIMVARDGIEPPTRGFSVLLSDPVSIYASVDYGDM